MSIRNGRLRHQVTLQQLSLGSPQLTPMGAPYASWTDVATVWADIRPLRGQMLMAARQVNEKISVEIEIRYRAGVVARMRAKHGTTIYDIEWVDNPRMLNEKLLLQCSTGLNQG